MKDYKKNLVAGGMAASLALSVAASGAALADAPQTVETANDAVLATVENMTSSLLVKANAAEGTFAFDQTTITPNTTIASTFRPATATLCSATTDFAEVNPLEWKLSVTGDVDNEFTATVDELAGEDSVQQTMTCTCGGNPADGRAIVTADVKGIPVTYLLDRAMAQAGVNTVAFVSSDGTEIAMPLSYVVAHHGVISYEVNGEDLSASVGGNNQLWLASASANYFVRDIVEVRVTEVAEVPPAPGEGMEYPNSPNVGITASQLG